MRKLRFVLVFFVFIFTLPGITSAESPKPPGADRITCLSLANEIERKQKKYEETLTTGGDLSPNLLLGFLLGGALGLAAVTDAHHNEMKNEIESLRKSAESKGCKVVPPPLVPPNPPSWEDIEKDMNSTE